MASGCLLFWIFALTVRSSWVAADAVTLPTAAADDSNSTYGNSDVHHEHSPGRYQLAVFDFSYVETPFLITVWILLGSIAKIAFHISKRLPSIFPESCMLVVLGLVVGLIIYAATMVNGSTTERHVLTATTFFLFLLPPIVLEAGYFMPNRAFFDNIGTILLYAVVGTIFNAFTIGLSIYGCAIMGAFGAPIKLLHCLLFGTLISAVDPVAVLAVFEEVHVNEVLHIIVFGESLLNDAVTVVLYHMCKEYTEIGEENIATIDIFAGVGSFFIVGIGGMLIGVAFGFLTAFVTRFTEHVRVIEPVFVFVMSYMAYLCAELFHLSGIMATVFCGITMKQYVEANISQKSHTTVKYFMKMLSSCSETIIFMFLGLSTAVDTHDWNHAFVALTLIFCLVYRALGVLMLTWVANRFRLVRLNKVEQFVMAYGGLRGAVSFSLAILVSSSVPQRRLFITTTIAEVFFTVFVQGMTIKPLVDRLHVKRSDKHKPTMNEEIHERLIDHLMAGIEDIAGHHGHHWLRDKFEHYNNHYLMPKLIKGNPACRDHHIVEVYTKLAMKDAMDYLDKHGTMSGIEGTSCPSLSHLIRNYSHGQNLNASTPNGTVLDLNELDAQYSKKDADDAVGHHAVIDNMFKIRKRHKKYTRHQLPDDDLNHPPFHHNQRLLARHLLSKPAGRRSRSHHHHYHHHGSSGGSHHSTPHHGGGHSYRALGSNGGSDTALATDPHDMELDTLAVGESPDEPERRISQTSQGKIRKNVSFFVGEDSGDELRVKLPDEEGEDDGIHFTVDSFTDGVKEEEGEGEARRDEPPSPTVAEKTLPWKRSQSEEEPRTADFPSWALRDDDPISPPPTPATAKPNFFPENKQNIRPFADSRFSKEDIIFDEEEEDEEETDTLIPQVIITMPDVVQEDSDETTA